MSPMSRTAVVLGALAAKGEGGPRRLSNVLTDLLTNCLGNQMAFDKDAFLTALDSMTVMELNDLVKAIERSLA